MKRKEKKGGVKRGRVWGGRPIHQGDVLIYAVCRMNAAILLHPVTVVLTGYEDTIRYETRCYFNVRSKADMSQLNLPAMNEQYRTMSE